MEVHTRRMVRSHTYIGRGSVFSTVAQISLTKTTGTHTSSLPSFYKQALKHFREVPFEKAETGRFTCTDEAKAEPTWTSKLFTITNRAFHETWRGEIARFNRVLDYFTPFGELWTPTQVYHFFQRHFKLDHRGYIRLPGRIAVDPDRLSLQWASFIRDCPEYIIQSA